MTWTKLHDICEHSPKDVKQIYELVRAHPETILEVDDHGFTPLHVACASWPVSLDAIQSLLTACPQVITDQDVHGDTVLHLAASNPKADGKLILLLLTACPTLASVTNREGLMPLHSACRYGVSDEDVIRQLIDANPSALRSHIKRGYPVLRRTKGDDGNEAMESPEKKHFVRSGLVARSGVSSIELKYQQTSQQIRDGAYPLHMAVTSGAPAGVVELLLREAVDELLLMTNKFGETPLHVALSHGATDDVVDLLVTRCPQAACLREKEHGYLPIHLAAMNGCSARVAKQVLSAYPQAIHHKSKHGMKPLEMASEHKTLTLVELLEESTDDALAASEIDMLFGV